MKASIRDGNAAVFLTLAFCLAFSFGGIALVFLSALGMVAASRFKLVPDALRLYVSEWLRSDAFLLNCLILFATLVEIGLMFYHGDDSGELEPQVKQYFAALAVLLAIRRYPLQPILWGAAAGCLVAGSYAAYELAWLGLERADGPTNAIRFGMIAALLTAFSWIGLLFARLSRGERMVMALACVAGVFAVFASGSRGAVLAMPFMLLLATPRIWRRSPRAAVAAGVIFIVFSIGLGIWQVSTVRTNLSNLSAALTEIAYGKPVQEQSARNRVEMLRMAKKLFLTHPIAGVGDNGWKAAVAEEMRTKPPGTSLDEAFNQAHNQYANDFAKGGLLRGLTGVAMLLVPLYCFMRRRPFDPGEKSLAALLGATTAVAFAVFSLTESVMDLSLTASVYAILIFYLIAASEGAPLDTPRRRLRPAKP